MCYYFTSGSREINPNLSQALIAEARMLYVIMHYYCARCMVVVAQTDAAAAALSTSYKCARVRSLAL